jgi:aminoglycoside/choline kinase family phosphotransferase
MGPNDPRHRANPPETLDAVFADAVDACFGSARLQGVTPLAGDASSRRYYRLDVADGAAVPQTVVAMVLGPDRLPLSSEELAVFDSPPTELPYINVGRFLARIGLRIPALYHHDAAAGLLLIEDIGDQSLRAVADRSTEPDVLRLYREAIDQLVLMQVVGSRNVDPSCVAFQQRFDRRLLAWEFEHFIEYGAPSLSPEDAERMRAAFEPVLEQLVASPAVLAHRDFHGWNIHVHRGALYVIDFQDALLAPDAYDLASLLTDRDTANVITPAREEALIAYFIEARERLGHAVDDPARFRTHYVFCVLHRTLKVIGRFRYLADVKGKRRYLEYLPHVSAQARRAIERAPDLEDLRRLLWPHIEGTCAR